MYHASIDSFLAKFCVRCELRSRAAPEGHKVLKMLVTPFGFHQQQHWNWFIRAKTSTCRSVAPKGNTRSKVSRKLLQKILRSDRSSCNTELKLRLRIRKQLNIVSLLWCCSICLHDRWISDEPRSDPEQRQLGHVALFSSSSHEASQSARFIETLAGSLWTLEADPKV